MIRSVLLFSALVLLSACEDPGVVEKRHKDNETANAVYQQAKREWTHISSNGGAALWVHKGCYWSSSDTLGVRPVIDITGKHLCR